MIIEMIYLYIGKHVIKALHVNKSLLGQYSVQQAEKQFSVQLLKAGKIAHNDIVASAVKEVLSHLSGAAAKEKQVMLILPQEAFLFFRSEVPTDMAAPAVLSFMKEKARSVFPAHLDTVFYDFVTTENETKRIVSLYAMEEASMQGHREALQLLDLQVSSFVPDTLAYYKLFEKTLRRGKIEHILYGLYTSDEISAYLYDSFGLLEKEAFSAPLTDGKGVEEPLKKIGSEYESRHIKINRLILSGPLSDTVRQDTFTKDVGIWTNPLKRILPHFYGEYLKMLVPADNQQFPLLQFDVCFGALIFNIENKGFSLSRNSFSPSVAVMGGYKEPKKGWKIPGVAVPKEALFFILSFVGSFLVFTLLTRSPMGFNMHFSGFQAKPTAVPTEVPLPTATPTPVIKKETLNIKVLNGSGKAGKATAVKTILKDAGFTGVIVTDNADNYDFTSTEVAVKKGNDALFSLIKTTFADYTQSVKQTVLDEKSDADVVITFGSDFK
jgi:hypothetical protein